MSAGSSDPSVISQRESEPAVEITLTVRGATGDDWTVLISGHYRVCGRMGEVV